MTRTARPSGLLQMALVVAACAVAAAQQLPAPAIQWAVVKPIEPPATPLPLEAASAG